LPIELAKLTPSMTTPRSRLAAEATRPSSEAPPSSTPTPPRLPPPETFDIIPPLHQLLSRLLAQSPAIPGADGNTTAAGAGSTLSSDPNVLTYADLQPLEIQNLASEAGAIKSRIARARGEIKKLPDVERTIDEQMEEIAYLEAKIAEQRETLAGMARNAAGSMREEDGAMVLESTENGAGATTDRGGAGVLVDAK
jgi:hypothetical protein